MDSIILRLLMDGDKYGYQISKDIAAWTYDAFQIKEATLYAVFQRLERRELIESYQGEKSHGGKRKYYTITTLGKAYFHEAAKEWKEAKQLIDVFMEGV